MDRLLSDRAAEGCEVYRNRRRPLAIKILPPSPPSNEEADKDAKPKPPRKRKADDSGSDPKPKKPKTKPVVAESRSPSSSKVLSAPSKLLKVTLKLPPPPKPKEPETFPCCLCVSMSRDGLLRVHDPPAWWYDTANAAAAALGPCMAHAECARIVPETWVDEVESDEPDASGETRRESMVFGVDIIVKDRWNLVSVILFTAYTMVFQLQLSEMHGLHQAEEQIAWRADTVHQGQVPQSFPRVLCKRWTLVRHCFHHPRRG